MLHQINPPGCVNALKEIIQFQRRILVFACNSRISLPPKKEEFQSEFGDEIGTWLWIKLLRNKQDGTHEKTAFCKGIEQVNQYIRANPRKKRSILSAFDHDIKFDEAYSNPKFVFRYKTLDTDIKKALKILFTSFYTELMDSGFPPKTHSLMEKLDRDYFISSFWQANSPNFCVCPACDGPRSDRIETKIFDDADHFFPKKDYPFFAVHPSNLVPLCLSCNRSFKGDRDPIDSKGTAPLINTFHPYGNQAINHINLIIQESFDTKDVLVVKAKEQDGTASRRVKSLNRLLKLEARWSGRLNDEVVPSIENHIRSMGRRLRMRKPSRTQEDLKEELHGFLSDYLDDELLKIGSRNNYILLLNYVKYVLQAEELDGLLPVILGQKETRLS